MQSWQSRWTLFAISILQKRKTETQSVDTTQSHTASKSQNWNSNAGDWVLGWPQINRSHNYSHMRLIFCRLSWLEIPTAHLRSGRLLLLSALIITVTNGGHSGHQENHSAAPRLLFPALTKAHNLVSLHPMLLSPKWMPRLMGLQLSRGKNFRTRACWALSAARLPSTLAAGP